MSINKKQYKKENNPSSEIIYGIRVNTHRSYIDRSSDLPITESHAFISLQFYYTDNYKEL
jgi:hypothetical protein